MTQSALPSPASRKKHINKILRVLEKRGFLLQSDPNLISVASLVHGEPIKGSWWGHPQGRLIFWVCADLEDHPDVLVTRLIKKKLTYVHRKLWPALYCIASAKAKDKHSSLSPDAKKLLAAIKKQGELRSDEFKIATTNKLSFAIKELEEQLLIVSYEIHTESGSHAKVLLSWDAWAREQNLEAFPGNAMNAKDFLDSVLQEAKD